MRSPRHDGWLTVPEIKQPEQYSALLRVPIVGLPAANVTASFTIETSYMSLSCEPWETFPETDKRLQKYRKVRVFRDLFRTEAAERTVNDLPDGNTTFFVDGDMPHAALKNATVVARDRRPHHLYIVFARRDNSSIYMLSATHCLVTENMSGWASSVLPSVTARLHDCGGQKLILVRQVAALLTTPGERFSC
jgi:hypothetical protein